MTVFNVFTNIGRDHRTITIFPIDYYDCVAVIFLTLDNQFNKIVYISICNGDFNHLIVVEVICLISEEQCMSLSGLWIFIWNWLWKILVSSNFRYKEFSCSGSQSLGRHWYWSFHFGWQVEIYFLRVWSNQHTPSPGNFTLWLLRVILFGEWAPLVLWVSFQYP